VSKRIEDAETRKALLLNAFQILAYDGGQAESLQVWLKEHLAEQLSCCDICVREYHRARRRLKQSLQQ